MSDIERNSSNITSNNLKTSINSRSVRITRTRSSSMSDLVNQEIQIKSEFICHHEEKFKVLREMDKISNADLIESLAPHRNRKAIFKSGQGAGKSGSFFFFSHDNRFVIKTASY